MQNLHNNEVLLDWLDRSFLLYYTVLYLGHLLCFAHGWQGILRDKHNTFILSSYNLHALGAHAHMIEVRKTNYYNTILYPLVIILTYR